jgi:6-phosphogluconolactonase
MNNGQSPEVRVLPGPEELAHAAAKLFLAVSTRAIASRGRFVTVLSGGTTPRCLYLLLGSPTYQDAIDWAGTYLFQADERCVPPDHAESNYLLLRELLLSRIPLPGANVYRVKGEVGAEHAAQLYENDIKLFFGGTTPPVFDLILLGVGKDGHTASLFTGSAALQEKDRLAVPVYLDRPASDRVTLALPVINRAAHVVFLASGADKAGIIRHILGEGNTRGYPAGLVRPSSGSLTWLLDRDAAGKLVLAGD